MTETPPAVPGEPVFDLRPLTRLVVRVAAQAEQIAELRAEVDRLRGIHANGDWPRYLEARERMVRAEAALAEVERLREQLTLSRLAQFAPMGDNHHNAAVCPYCSPDRDRIVEAARRDALTGAMEGNALARAVGWDDGYLQGRRDALTEASKHLHGLDLAVRIVTDLRDATLRSAP